MKWLLFAFRNLFRNRRRTLLTLIIAATGCASILSSSGFALFTYRALAENAANSYGHLTLAHPDYFVKVEESPLDLGLNNYESLQKEIKSLSNVRAVLPLIEFSGLISTGDKSLIFNGNGIDPQALPLQAGVFSLQSGEILSFDPDTSQDTEILLGKTLAHNLQAKIGDGLTVLSTTTDGALNAVDVQVKGIVSTGIPELDKHLLLMDYQSIQELLGTDKISNLSVHLHEISDTENIAEQLQSQHPKIAIQTWQQQAVFYNKVKALYDRIFGTLGIILLIIVFFSVFNTLSMSVTERTREIGTLAAMGTYRKEILRIFMLEAFFIGVFGSIFGIISALITRFSMQLANIQMPPPPGRSEGYPFQIDFSNELALYTALALTIVCILAAWLAARRGVNKPIVDALGDV